jgi:hypothetical protein
MVLPLGALLFMVTLVMVLYSKTAHSFTTLLPEVLPLLLGHFQIIFWRRGFVFTE